MMYGRFAARSISIGFADALLIRRTPLDSPHVRFEERRRVVVRVTLDVLRQRQRHRARLGRVGHDPHRLRQRHQDLLRPRDPVEVAAHHTEAVGHRHVLRAEVLDALEHHAAIARRVVVRREQQHRDPADRRRGRSRDHVGRAGPDRRRARHRRLASLRSRKAGRGVDHRLLVARLVVRQIVAVLDQCLAEARHVAVPEDAPQPLDEAFLLTVVLAVLDLQEPHDRLRERQPLLLLRWIELHDCS